MARKKAGEQGEGESEELGAESEELEEVFTAAPSKEESMILPPPQTAPPPAARYEVRTVNKLFKGTRGGGVFENKQTKKTEIHEGVRIVDGVGYTDDRLVANECVRLGYQVTDRKDEGK